ncbi:DNA methyltransferase [Moritella viscosa]|uniref:hypothetical protein n=1 Tax=Moritella viscosa TaxID=80854 RepID=UPI000508FB36|nr:hypothetical protein [Moritella viscosa]CED59947.1 putative uncharacterized phage protein [Moritella viscosa]SHO03977.1 DNA methyltransferase [Moritella viscosa]SHO05294.1 DNA methyltransferase [Moritella viscosa]SHO21060.1 DNA methyltransferase [Moritella viscosa]
MKDEQIKIIVESILNETILDDWYFYLLLFLVSLLGAVFGSFIKSFGAEKGKYKAIESSLDIIKKQVSETTKTTEKIKKDIELNVWREKDREMLKREKLEEYFSFVVISQEAFHAEMENKLFKQENNYNNQAYNKAEMLQALYLPELADEHNEYRKAVVLYRDWLTAGMMDMQERIKNGEQNVIPSSEHMAKYSKIIQGFNPSLIAISDKAKEVAMQINT